MAGRNQAGRSLCIKKIRFANFKVSSDEEMIPKEGGGVAMVEIK